MLEDQCVKFNGFVRLNTFNAPFVNILKYSFLISYSFLSVVDFMTLTFLTASNKKNLPSESFTLKICLMCEIRGHNFHGFLVQHALSHLPLLRSAHSNCMQIMDEKTMGTAQQTHSYASGCYCTLPLTYSIYTSCQLRCLFEPNFRF